MIRCLIQRTKLVKLANKDIAPWPFTKIMNSVYKNKTAISSRSKFRDIKAHVVYKNTRPQKYRGEYVNSHISY